MLHLYATPLFNHRPAFSPATVITHICFQAAITVALADYVSVQPTAAAKRRHMPRRGAQFARGCDGTQAGGPAPTASTRGHPSPAGPSARGTPSGTAAPRSGRGTAVSYPGTSSATAAPQAAASGSRKRPQTEPGAMHASETGAGSSSAAHAFKAAVLPPGELFSGALMWNPEEYYQKGGPVFRAVRGSSMAGAIGGPSGRAGTPVPSSLLGALPDPGILDCRDAVLCVLCSLEQFALAARALMHASTVRAPSGAGGRRRRGSGRKTDGKARRGAKEDGAGRGTLPGGTGRALVFQVLSTTRVMRRLQRVVERAVGSARSLDMSCSSSLGTLHRPEAALVSLLYNKWMLWRVHLGWDATCRVLHSVAHVPSTEQWLRLLSRCWCIMQHCAPALHVDIHHMCLRAL